MLRGARAVVRRQPNTPEPIVRPPRRTTMFGHEWKDRWCVLHPVNLLYYFDAEDDTQPAGVYMLTERTQVTLHRVLEGKTWVLEVNVDPTDAMARTVFLSAKDQVTAEA